MRAICNAVESRATVLADKSVADRRPRVASVVAAVSCDSSVADESDWFSKVVRQLLPREKAGLAVCTHAGLDHEINLRSCERYAAGHVKVTGWIVRALLRGDSGLTWLSGYMDGVNPQWWQDVKDGLEILDAVRRVQASQRERTGQG